MREQWFVSMVGGKGRVLQNTFEVSLSIGWENGPKGRGVYTKEWLEG